MSNTYTTLSADGPLGVHSHETNGVAGVQITAIGTWGGGTLVFKQKHSDGTWRSIIDGSFTADASQVLDVASGTQVSGDLSGATTPSLFVEIVDMVGR